ncbi:MAG: molecular chaperone DnaK, partial [Pseudomonadota bacterium]
KLTDDVKEEVKAAMTDAKSALDGEDVEALKTASANLAQTAMKIGEAVYGAGGDAGGDAEGGPDGSGEPGAQDDNVVDADFEEVDDDKKKSA